MTGLISYYITDLVNSNTMLNQPLQYKKGEAQFIDSPHSSDTPIPPPLNIFLSILYWYSASPIAHSVVCSL